MWLATITSAVKKKGENRCEKEIRCRDNGNVVSDNYDVQCYSIESVGLYW